jgi:hypothetical protein
MDDPRVKEELLDDPYVKEVLARIRAAEEKAWWRDMTRLVAKTDQQLAVIAPRSDATAEDLLGLGQVLARWQIEFPQARHIWGLTDLLEGRGPRTPPPYLAIPFSTEKYDEAFHPVALAYVAQGTDIEAAVRELAGRLESFRSRLAWFESPDAYSYYQR